MPSQNFRQIQLGSHKAVLHGVSDSDPYWNGIPDQAESEFQAVIDTLIPANGVCIDIGANIGIKTFSMAKQAKDGAVLAIEAAPNVYEALRLNILNNKLDNVVSVNAAVTDTNTTVHFVDNSAWGHVATDGAVGKEVPGETLENLVHVHQEKFVMGVDFIKIDTEGHEYKIMKNAFSVFQRYKPWVFFEFNSFCLSGFGDTNPKELLTWVFQNFKYVFRLEKNTLNAGLPLLRRFEFKDVIHLLHENIVLRGSVDDFLVTNRESALSEVRDLLKPNPFIRQNLELQKRITALESLPKTNAAQLHTATAQLQATTAQLEAIKQSRSWRITAPLRAVGRFLRKFSR